jgi:hypothetical protein
MIGCESGPDPVVADIRIADLLDKFRDAFTV